jgi:hypothetical protein
MNRIGAVMNVTGSTTNREIDLDEASINRPRSSLSCLGRLRLPHGLLALVVALGLLLGGTGGGVEEAAAWWNTFYSCDITFEGKTYTGGFWWYDNAEGWACAVPFSGGYQLDYHYDRQYMHFYGPDINNCWEWYGGEYFGQWFNAKGNLC